MDAALYRPIQLKQVATIEDGLDEVRKIARLNGISSVGFGIKKIKGADAVAVARGIKSKVIEINKTLPEGFTLVVAKDNSIVIEDSIHELVFTLIISILLTAFVCRLFLGDWTSAGNVIFAIPTSIVGTFFILYLLGFTLNTFTLMALSLVVGIVVDDAIVVLENISRHKSLGMDWKEAALSGTNEVRFAAFSSSISIVAIFLPVAFM